MKTSFSIINALADIWTEFLWNVSLVHYCWATLFIYYILFTLPSEQSKSTFCLNLLWIAGIG